MRRHPALALVASAMALVVLGCSAVVASPAPPPTATTQPTSASDNPTAGAIARATRAAAATSRSAATQAVLASQTAAAGAAATQTADALAAATSTVAARATLQALYAAEHTWPQRIQETFADNQLGWPSGLTQDQYLAVTSTVIGGRYQWLAAIAKSGAYTNLAPSKEEPLGDFYAAVDVTFVQGNDDGQVAYGLAFRLVDPKQDFGFFGITKTGSFLVLETHASNVDQNVYDSSREIHTQAGAPNRLAVVGIGTDFVCLVNDVPVIEMGANLAPGQVGVGVEAIDASKPAEVDFTNFEVRTPP
jgi:hypothetical protein